MRTLVVSDIHGNWDALDAVLTRHQGGYEEIVCCGDLVGYGPDPGRIVDWARAECRAIVRGNHDRAATGTGDFEWFNPTALAAAQWTAAQLSEGDRAWLHELPVGPLLYRDFALVHGSPIDEDAYIVHPLDAEFTFPYVNQPLTFFGHTHAQGGFEHRPRKILRVHRPSPMEDHSAYPLTPDSHFLINPGAVGQPRDGDPRAASAIYDSIERCVHFHRTPYNVERVQHKILAAGLPESLAIRLANGR